MEIGRRVPRLKKSLPFELPDGWRGEVVDLSAVGLRVQSLVLLPRSTVIDGMLIFPGGKRVLIKGTVMWSKAPDHAHNQPAEIGIELIDAPEAYLRALAELFADS